MSNPSSPRRIVLHAQRCALKCVLMCVLLCTLFCAGGCSPQPSADYSGLSLLAVSGQVTLDGAPLQRATIRLESSDQRYSYGVTDANGNYTMMLNSEKSGVLPGIKTVRITSLPTAESSFGEVEGFEELEETEASTLAAEQERVPHCYNHASRLKLNLTESRRSLDFHLKSDCSEPTATEQ